MTDPKPFVIPAYLPTDLMLFGRGWKCREVRDEQ